MVPIRKTVNRKFFEFISTGFFLAITLYMAKAKAAANIHQSPLLNEKVSSVCQLPLLNNKRIPMIQMVIPMIRERGIFSFKNILARITDMMGEEVVPISAMFMASEK